MPNVFANIIFSNHSIWIAGAAYIAIGCLYNVVLNIFINLFSSVAYSFRTLLEKQKKRCQYFNWRRPALSILHSKPKLFVCTLRLPIYIEQKAELHS